MSDEMKMANTGSLDQKITPLTDTQLLQWLCDHMEFDGYGYWLPEICICERRGDQEAHPIPKIDDLRLALNDIAIAK